MHMTLKNTILKDKTPCPSFINQFIKVPNLDIMKRWMAAHISKSLIWKFIILELSLTVF